MAVDALVEVQRVTRPTDEQFLALFEPKGVVVAGASSHPGKFGFVSLHNLLASGYQGRVFATNLQGEEVLGIASVASIDDLPEGQADLVFVCTPAAANPDVLQACARRGIRAAFITSAGYGEAGEAGRRAENELVALADELGILLAGPNGQGVVSTPAHLCAQIVAPYPPAGPHRRGQPERQLRLELPELRDGDRASASRGPSRPATPRPSPSPTTSTSTPTIRPPRSASPTSKASPTAVGSPSASARWPRASRSCS